MLRAKKRFGQHFLINDGIVLKIISSITRHNNYDQLVEVGPGKGVLTKELLNLSGLNVTAIEVDKEAIEYLKGKVEFENLKLLEADFLKYDLSKLDQNIGVVGNFPYNISSQIFFKILEYKDQVQEVVAMLQKEVARRLSSKEGNKEYGILSVLLQCWYSVELLFEVSPGSFNPPPKVTSAVVRLKRNSRTDINCDEALFKVIVKQGFQNRRKTLWNALKPINLPQQFKPSKFMGMRAEQLTVNDFIELTKQVEEWKKS